MDATIHIQVNNNSLAVKATYLPPQHDGKRLSVNDILLRLDELGITTGINHDALTKICTSEKPLRNVTIAEAIPPQVGEKGRVETYFILNKQPKAVERDDGGVDFHELGEIASAQKGNKLYRKIPPTIGKSGVNVYGEEIPGIPGKDLRIVLGPGTELDENDPNLVKASMDGEILFVNGVVQVSKVHVIHGDVDFSTGNVTFNGSIKIDGTVKAGFRVHAEGDIEIKGNVEDAEVIGKNDIIIMGGYTGNGEGNVYAGRDVIVKFAENQKITADRDIIINGPSYHSQLSAGRSIIAQGGKSVIIGGLSEAKQSIEAKKLGSTAAAHTTIKVGINPKLAKMLKQIEDNIEQIKESKEKLEKSIIFLYRLKIDSKGTLPADKQVLLKKLEKTKKSLPDKLTSLEILHNKYTHEQKDVQNAVVIADIAVYPKVKIYIGQQFVTTEDTYGPSVFKILKGEIMRLSK